MLPQVQQYDTTSNSASSRLTGIEIFYERRTIATKLIRSYIKPVLSGNRERVSLQRNASLFMMSRNESKPPTLRDLQLRQAKLRIPQYNGSSHAQLFSCSRAACTFSSTEGGFGSRVPLNCHRKASACDGQSLWPRAWMDTNVIVSRQFRSRCMESSKRLVLASCAHVRERVTSPRLG